MEEVIVGALIALGTGVVIPFVTTQYSLWAAHKRSLYDARREAVTALIEAQADEQINIAEQTEWVKASGNGGSAGPTETTAAAIRAARQRLYGLFTTSDKSIRQLMIETAPASPYATPYTGSHVEMVLATWAAGRNWRAIWAARKQLVKIREGKQRDLREPETQSPNTPGSEPEQ